jgi:predicted Zn-dependent protease
MKRYDPMRTLLVMILLLTGCSGSFPGLIIEPQQLSTTDEIVLGKAALPYTIQLLGGHYPDPDLQATLDQTLKRLVEASRRLKLPYQVHVADHTKPRLDVLSGGQIVASRGLLADLNSRTDLEQVLGQALEATSRRPFGGEVTRSLVRSAGLVLEGRHESLSSASPPVKLAEAFVERGGLALLPLVAPADDLPTSWKRLQEARPAYELLNRAQRLEADGDRNSAIATYLQAAAAAPEEPHIVTELGMAYLRADDRQSARIYLGKAVKLQPAYYRTRMGLGYLAMQAGRLDEAKKQLETSVTLLPVTENLFLLAQVYEALGEPVQALEIYRNIKTDDGHSKLGRAAHDRLKELERPR